MSEIKNITHLPDDVWQRIGELTQERWLASIPGEHRTAAPAPSNARPYRQWSAAMKCVEVLLETTPPMHTAFVTLTTKCRDAKWANRNLSTILEKVLAPSCIQWIRFFDRGRNGYVHWHLIVALRFPVLNTDHEFWTFGERIRRRLSVNNCPYDKEREMDKVLSDNARALTDRCCSALRKARVGFKARVDPIIYPEKIGTYCAKYLAKTTRRRRFWRDPGLRLWSVSKGARVANSDVHVISQWSRISRLKNAAYCSKYGWFTMEEARREDPKWQYHSREIMRDKKLRTYLHEADYVLEWGNRWSPQASGVRILHPDVRPSDGRVFQYVHNQQPTDPEELAELTRVWNGALEVPKEIWFGGNQ